MGRDMRRKRKFVCLTIKEAYPVFFKGEPIGSNTHGPFYSAGSQWFDLYSERKHTAKEISAAYLRNLGYTVKIEIIER